MSGRAAGVAALVLAGARPGWPDPAAQAAGVAHKALASVGGRPLLARVLGALAAAGVGPVSVSAADAEVAALARSFGATVLPPADGPSASVLAGAETGGTPLLVTTADHPFLQAQWVARFLADAPADADVCALVASRAAVEAAAPDGPCRTWLRFADGEWSGCNLFLIRTPRGLEAVRFWRRVEAQRKRPWRMAQLIGPGAVLLYALRRLTLAGALSRLGRAAGVRAAIVPCPHGLCAVDVDTEADLRFARARLGP